MLPNIEENTWWNVWLIIKTSLFLFFPRRNLNYFSNAYAAAVSAVDPDAGNGELCIKVPSELWKHVDGKTPKIYWLYNKIMLDLVTENFYMKINDVIIVN